MEVRMVKNYGWMLKKIDIIRHDDHDETKLFCFFFGLINWLMMLMFDHPINFQLPTWIPGGAIHRHADQGHTGSGQGRNVWDGNLDPAVCNYQLD